MVPAGIQDDGIAAMAAGEQQLHECAAPNGPERQTKSDILVRRPARAVRRRSNVGTRSILNMNFC